MTRHLRPRRLVLAALAAVVAASVLGAAAARPRGTSTAERLADATIIVEVNATDGDAGLQVFLDGEPWKAMRITAPGGKPILDVQTKTRLRGHGLTELFSESSEPPFATFPLDEFKALFPEGTYRFSGRTIEGTRLVGSARLSHDIPAGPEIVAPAEDATVGRRNLVASWTRGDQPKGVQIVGYRAIVTREDPLRIFSADLPASVRRITIPAQFLERRTEYKLEVQAIEASGNQTLTEVPFQTR